MDTIDYDTPWPMTLEPDPQAQNPDIGESIATVWGLVELEDAA